jgi:hypothetical protein
VDLKSPLTWDILVAGNIIPTRARSMTHTPPKVKRVIICGIIGSSLAAYLFAHSGSLILPLIVLVFFALLCSIFCFMAVPIQTPVKETNVKEVFQFSLARLLVATAAVAIVLGIMKALHNFKTPGEIIISLILSFVVGSITLISKEKDIRGIIFTILWCIIAIIFMFFILPIILYILFTPMP